MDLEYIDVDTARTLADVALLAAWEGNTSAAEAIFNALRAAKPKEVNVAICLAMVFASQENYTESIAVLNQALREEPENACGKSLLGYVLFAAGESGWETLLNEVINDGTDRAAVNMAQQVLNENMPKQKAADAAVASMSNYIPYA
jgi:predicted Zn-dependent protease